MLVQNSIYRNTYLTDGVNKDFYFSFPILESSQVLVQTSLLTNTDVVTTIDPSQYTVTGVGLTTGGHISFTTAPPTGSRIALTLNIPITQLYQYAELDSFPAKSHEDALAKLTLICQQLKEQLERAVRLPPTSSDSSETVIASVYASRDAAAASASTASNKADAAEVSAQAAANSASAATAQANAAHDSALAAAQSAAEAAATPATTTSRGIGRVATLADMGPGATVENGPAFLAAGRKYILPLSWIPGLFVGKIDFLPFAPADLATYCPGWYFCNGDNYTLSSAGGKALEALPTSFKTAWGIVVSGSNISVPNLFHSDGRGYFLRAVNGTTRLVGGVEMDDLQSHAHITKPAGKGGTFNYTGGSNFINAGGEDGYTTNTGGEETRPMNVGMTPAIFLDV